MSHATAQSGYNARHLPAGRQPVKRSVKRAVITFTLGITLLAVGKTETRTSARWRLSDHAAMQHGLCISKHANWNVTERCEDNARGASSIQTKR